MDAAMHPDRAPSPDRVPVMCQLALGHCFLRAGLDAIDIWHDSGAFATALVTLQRRYRFDGILVNLPHTCGAIGDRLELMAETGTDGIDTLDPPPLGTVDLGYILSTACSVPPHAPPENMHALVRAVEEGP